MERDEDPKFWVRVVKIVVWTIVFIVLVSLGLYYSAKFSTYAPPSGTSESTGGQWGISKDSPIRSNR